MAVAAIGLVSTPAQAQPSLRLNTNQRGDFILIGNSMGWDCDGTIPAPVVGTTPTLGECGIFSSDSSPDTYWVVNDNGTAATAFGDVEPGEARTQAVLTLPAGTDVTHAFLYWSGERSGAGTPVDQVVTFDRPDGAGGTEFTAQVTAIDATVAAPYFNAVADVTDIVAENGSGIYRVSGLDIKQFNATNDEILWGSWSLVVLYEAPNLGLRNITVWDGLDQIIETNKATAFLDGFVVPDMDFDARLGVVAYEGDAGIVGDQLRFGVAPLDETDSLSNPLNPVDDFFNGTRSYLGAPVSVTGDLPQFSGAALSFGNIDFDIVDITDRLTPGQTFADVEAITEGDAIYLSTLITSIATFKPEFDLSNKTAEDVNGEPLFVGDELVYTITVINSGDDTSIDTVVTDALPIGVTYVPGTLEIVSGLPAAGPLTDAAGDDQGEYNAATRTVTVRVGDGANATDGGEMDPDQTVVIRFSVTIDSGAEGTISNQAIITAGGASGLDPEETSTDANTDDPGQQPTDVVIEDCPPGDLTCRDSDGDGLTDAEEIAIGTDPADADSDDDGVPDGEEPDYDEDTDGDGLINALDPDSDNDGLRDGTELGRLCNGPGTDNSVGNCVPDADEGSTTTDPLNPDTDGGGVSDGSEDRNLNGSIDGDETNPTAGNGADDASVVDTDGDGLSDGLEAFLGSDPNDADSDDDGVSDGDEANPSLDTDGDGDINVLDPDSDDDGLFDGTEVGNDCDGPGTDAAAGNCIPDGDGGATTTSPLNPDTDGGGVSDGDEDTNKNGVVDAGERDPNDPADDNTDPTGSGGAGGAGGAGGGDATGTGGAVPLGASIEGGAFACAIPSRGAQGSLEGMFALLTGLLALGLRRRR